MSRRGRDLLVPTGCLVAVGILTTVAAGQLPDPVAIRFADADPFEHPSYALSFVPRWLDLVLWPVASLGVLGLGVAAAPRVRTRRAARDLLGAVNALALVVVLYRWTIWQANAGLVDAGAATLPAFAWLPIAPPGEPGSSYHLLMLCIGAWGAGVGLAVLLSGRARPVAPPPLVPRALATRHPERTVWTGRARLSLRAAAMTTAGFLPMLAVLPLVAGPMVIGAALGALVALPIALRHAWVEVVVGPEGIRVRTRPRGVRWRVGWDEVRAVELVDVDVRDSVPVRRAFRCQAILRSGPALRILRTRHQPIIVTVDGAEVAAAVAGRHLAARHAAAGRADLAHGEARA